MRNYGAASTPLVKLVKNSGARAKTCHALYTGIIYTRAYQLAHVPTSLLENKNKKNDTAKLAIESRENKA